MSYTIRSDAEKRELVRGWRASGLSLTRFAYQHGVSSNGLRQWSSALRPSSATTRFVEVETVELGVTASLVVEVARTGHRVVVPVGFDAGELRRLVAALC